MKDVSLVILEIAFKALTQMYLRDIELCMEILQGNNCSVHNVMNMSTLWS